MILLLKLLTVAQNYLNLETRKENWFWTDYATAMKKLVTTPSNETLEETIKTIGEAVLE